VAHKYTLSGRRINTKIPTVKVEINLEESTCKLNTYYLITPSFGRRK
jgi:hypothetical protein